MAAAVADTYGSTSTLSAETATGSHVLNIEDYSLTKVLHGAGFPLPSDTFAVGGWSWRIMFSPRGASHKTADCICLVLCLEPPEPGGAAMVLGGTMVSASFSVLDQTGQALPSSIREESVRALSTSRSLIYTPFMKRTRFECCYVKDNRVSVRCDVTLVTRTCRLSDVVPPPDLRRHLGELLASGVGADVTLEVGGEAFAAHRSVLAARSPVLIRGELLGVPPHDKEDDAAAVTMRVRIHDIEPSVFRALLHFIYTDSLPEMDAGDEKAMAQRLLVAAQRYGLEGLKWLCEDVLCTLRRSRRAAKQLSLPSRPAACKGWAL